MQPGIEFEEVALNGASDFDARAVVADEVAQP